jgi:hypothetical protein
MKKIIALTIILIIGGAAISAQTLQTELLYQKYRGQEGVLSVWIPGIALKLAASIADLDCEEDELLRSIKSVRVLTIEDNDLYPGVNFAKEANITPGREGYQVLVQVQDGAEDVLILGRERQGKLKDILILVGGEDNVMVHIKGRINADLISSLARVAGLEEIELLGQL